MSRSIARRIPMLAVLLVVGLGGTAAGCTSHGSTAPSNPPAVTSEDVATPATEATGAESPQAPVNQPAVRVASLPVGGNGNLDDSGPNPQCVTVTWSGPPSLGHGIQVRIDQTTVDGDFSSAGDCGGNQPSCSGFTFSDGSPGCGVNVGWTAAPPSVSGASSSGPVELHGHLSATGTCVAPDPASCQSWAGQIPNGQAGIELSLTLNTSG